MKEYVLRILSREKEQPLLEATIIEMGVRADEPEHLIKVLQITGDTLKHLKTPEAVAEMMQDMAHLPTANLKFQRK